jgi:hypothetical protein
MTWTFGPAELKKNSTFTFISNNILDLEIQDGFNGRTKYKTLWEKLFEMIIL